MDGGKFRQCEVSVKWSSETKGKWYQTEVWNIRSKRRATEMINIWVKIADYFYLWVLQNRFARDGNNSHNVWPSFSGTERGYTTTPVCRGRGPGPSVLVVSSTPPEVVKRYESAKKSFVCRLLSLQSSRKGNNYKKV